MIAVLKAMLGRRAAAAVSRLAVTHAIRGAVAALDRRGVMVTVECGGLTIEGPDESVYDLVRDALVESEAPLRRMGPRRRALAELFEADVVPGEPAAAGRPRQRADEESQSSRQRALTTRP